MITPKFSEITAYEILASGGYPTVEARVVLNDGSVGVASVPYGASAGSREAIVMNDEDTKRFNGKGVLRAVGNITDIIAPELVGKPVVDQRAVDQKLIDLDGTEDKSRLGGNAVLAVSLAVARAVAHHQEKELFQYIADTFQTKPEFDRLPQPMIVVIEGGKHADETTDLQEYCISAVASKSPTEGIRQALESYHALKGILKENGLSTNVGNEGAFAPNGIPTNESPFEDILKSIEKAGYSPGEDLGISIDAAASEFYKNGKYSLAIEDKNLTAAELISYYEKWFKNYPIVTVEDMLDENDWENWVKLQQVTEKYNITLIGDDLTVTNKKYLQKAIDMEAISGVLIKLNQIGSLTETVDACMLAQKHGLLSVPSHRGGGETNDTAMVDLAVAVNGSFIKVGPTRGERVSKYNRLMEIERKLAR